MSLFEEKITFDKFIRTLTVVVLMVFAYFLLRRLSGVLIPFFVAWLFAYLLYPIVCFFQYKCRLKSRILSIIVTIVLVVGIITGVCCLVIPPAIDEMARVKAIAMEYLSTKANATALPESLNSWIKNTFSLDNLKQYFSFSDIKEILQEGVPKVFSLLTSSVNAIIGLVASCIAVLYLIFILMDYENMAKGLINLVPKDNRQFVATLISDVKNGMNGYFRGQSLVALCVGILFAIGFVIIGFPMAIPLGLFIGALNLVPYLQGVGLIPTVLLSLIEAYDTGGNFWFILFSALMVFVVVQTIQDSILVPTIMGNVTGLNAAVILLSLSIWGSLLGIIGLIIALPLTTLILSYYKRYILKENKPLVIETNEKAKSKKKGSFNIFKKLFGKNKNA